MDDIITLDYGSGGRKTSCLVEEIILPAFSCDELNCLGDGALLQGMDQMAFSTDSFVVSPLFFPGGDIGKLAVCGTVNDIAMCGAEPRWLSCSFIIEEGLETEMFRRIVTSMGETAKKAGVKIVTGDTKVVERGHCDGVYINTSGIGRVIYPGLSTQKIRPGDAVILSGCCGDHGTAVMLSRSGMLSSKVESDCAPLHKLAAAALAVGGVKVLRDPTRGGVATTLNEFVEDSEYGIVIDETAVPVRAEVSAVCDMLGLDPLYCANEGKLLAVVAPEKSDEIINELRRCPEGRDAAIIGHVSENFPSRVILNTEAGGRRILQKLSGAQLPRIC